MSRIPVVGKFLLDDGSLPKGFQGTMEGSRAALISVGEYRDLGPIEFRLDDTGEVMRLLDGSLVPLTVPRALPDQPFHWNVSVFSRKIDHFTAAVTVPEGMTEIDLPTALREAIPVEDLPEWLVVRDVVESARDEAVAAAGEATLAVAGLDAAIQDAVDTKVPAAVDQKITEIDLPVLVGDEISLLAGPAVQVEVDARVDPLVTRAEEAADGAVAARDGMVIGGTVSGDDLILSTVDGGSLVAGNVRGPEGGEGAAGPAPSTSWAGTALVVEGVTGPDLKGPKGDTGDTGAPGALADASTYILTGPGRPDTPATTGGIITGSEPVGAEYRSTDGANVGAWVWMKRPAGWIVTDGDTGVREIKTLLLADNTAGSLELSRVGPFVTLQGDTLKQTTRARKNAFTMPNGFWWRRPFTVLFTTPVDLGVYGAIWGSHTVTGMVQMFINAGDANLAPVTWRTDQPWPITLPGTPA